MGAEAFIAEYGPIAAIVAAFVAVYQLRGRDATEQVGRMKTILDEVQEERDGMRAQHALEVSEMRTELAKCQACRAELERELGRLRRDR